MRKLFIYALVFFLSIPVFSGCGGSDEPEGPSYTEQMVYLLTILKNSTESYTGFEKSEVKPYLEKAVVDIDEALGLIRQFQADEDLPFEFLNDVSVIVARASQSVKEAALRSDVTDNRYELLQKALDHVADRLTFT